MNPPLSAFTVPIACTMMAGWILFTAIRVIVSQKPVVFSRRWGFVFMCLLLLPGAFGLLSLVLSSPAAFSAAFVAVYLLLLGYFWTKSRGYVVLGVSRDYFREALAVSASDLGFTLEEAPERRGFRVRINETGQEIKVVLKGRGGVAGFGPINRSSRELVRHLARGMRKYFATVAGEMNYRMAILQIAFSLIIVAGAISMVMDGIRSSQRIRESIQRSLHDSTAPAAPATSETPTRTTHNP